MNGIDQTLNTLKAQSQQISSIEKQIQQIISLDGALKGEADKASGPLYRMSYSLPTILSGRH
ncbi:T7SS effector LXG polymorphic toxin [Bacillus sp. SL00103]